MNTYILFPEYKTPRGDIVDLVTELWTADRRWVVGEHQKDASIIVWNHRTHGTLEEVCFAHGLDVKDVLKRKLKLSENTSKLPYGGPMIVNGDWCPRVRAEMSGDFMEVLPGQRYRARDEVPDGLGGWKLIAKSCRGKRIDGSLPVRRLKTQPKLKTRAFKLDLSFDLLVSAELTPKYSSTGEFVGFTKPDGSVFRPILCAEKQGSQGDDAYTDLTAKVMMDAGIEVIDMRDFTLTELGSDHG